MEKLFRRYVLRLLVRRERLAPETAERLMQWQPSGFSVWIGDPIQPQETESRRRLARYLLKPPLSLDRMHYDRERCTVTYVSHAQRRERTLSALDFLAELSVHVPDPGEHTAAYFGRYSNRSRGTRRQAAELFAAANSSAVGSPSPAEQTGEPMTPTRKAFRLAWAQLLQRVWKVDVTRCGRCGGAMRILEAVLSRDVVRGILEHLGVPWPRAPDPHGCPPPPGAQLRLPTRATRANGEHATDESEFESFDQQVHSDWPVDEPFPED